MEEKKRKSAAIMNAVFIGVLVGIVIFSIAKNGYGFFTLIPLYFAFKLFNKPKNDETS